MSIPCRLQYSTCEERFQPHILCHLNWQLLVLQSACEAFMRTTQATVMQYGPQQLRPLVMQSPWVRCLTNCSQIWCSINLVSNVLLDMHLSPAAPGQFCAFWCFVTVVIMFKSTLCCYVVGSSIPSLAVNARAVYLSACSSAKDV